MLFRSHRRVFVIAPDGTTYIMFVKGIGQVDPVRFKVKQRNEHPWNALVGEQWEISSSVHLMLEAGFGYRMSVLVATGYRF